MKIKYLIIGAGPTGLGAGWRLKELNINEFIILEKNSYPGGLAFTLKDPNGFLWDFGGHVLFSHYKYFDDVYEKVMNKNYYQHLRESYVIYSKNEWIPYPFQYNIHHFKNKQLIFELVKSAIINPYVKIKVKNFHDWILKIFGEKIAEIFMIPYNNKVWAIDPKLMNYHWVGERVATINPELILESAILHKDHISWGPNNKFKFPKYGGNITLWKNIAEKIKSFIKYETEVRKIDIKNKFVLTNKDNKINYQYLINTAPLDLFLKNSNANENIKKMSEKLKHSKVNVVGIGLKQPLPNYLKNKCWFYFPTNDIPIYRATIFSNYSPYNVPDIKKFWSIMTETSESKYKALDENFIEKTIKGLIKLGFIKNKNQINHVYHFSKEYAYPTPTLERDFALNKIQPYLEKYNIFSRGRFGGWKYEVSNQDHSFMQGVEVIDRLILKKKEITYYQPNFVNSKKFLETQK